MGMLDKDSPGSWATSSSPYTLGTDDDVRKALIAAYTTNGKNWIEHMKTLDEHVYDFPKDDKPIIWGLAPQYGVSKHMGNLITSGNLASITSENGKNLWDLKAYFVTLGSDDSMTEFIDDLYGKELPFVVSLEAPSIDFYGRDFVKVSLPRNPSNSELDSCFVAGQCSKPMSNLGKLANPKLAETFPQMLQFIEQWTMTGPDVIKILANAADGDKKKANTWRGAACDWMKANPQAIAKWHVDISEAEGLDDLKDSVMGPVRVRQQNKVADDLKEQVSNLALATILIAVFVGVLAVASFVHMMQRCRTGSGNRSTGNKGHRDDRKRTGGRGHRRSETDDASDMSSFL